MRKVTVIVLAACAAWLLSGCSGDGMYSASLVTGGKHRIQSGQMVAGDVLLLNGELAIEEGARVTGSVYQLEGHSAIDGEVGGDLSALGGSVKLGPTAHVAGDFSHADGNAERSSGAVIKGSERTANDLPAMFAPWAPHSASDSALQALWQTALMGVLAFLTVRYAKTGVERIGQAALGFPAAAAALGVLAGTVGLVLAVFMAFTVILIPASVLALLVLAATGAYGLVALGSVIGCWLVGVLRWRPRPALAASLGTMLLMLVSEALDLIPVLGGILPILVLSVGLGAVLLTRFGTQRFVPEVA